MLSEIYEILEDLGLLPVVGYLALFFGCYAVAVIAMGAF